jgi:membrane protein required for colicin V production
MQFAVIDIIFVALIVIFTLRCALKGFVSELLSMASVVLGLLAALYLYKRGGEFVRLTFMPGLNIIPEIAAFAALFLIVFITVKIVEAMLKGIIEGVRLGAADRFVGILFGFVEGLIVISLVLFLFSVQPLFDPAPILEHSFFAAMLMPFITGGKAGPELLPETAALLRSAAGV